MLNHDFSTREKSDAIGDSDGQTVTFSATGNAVLERSADIVNWQQTSAGVHAGARMAYRMRGTTGMGMLTVEG